MIEDLLRPHLNEADIKTIQSIQDIFSKHNLILLDRYRLLYDWLESMKSWLFFASSGIFYVFLEKYLRDLLIFLEFKERKADFKADDLLNELDKIEKEIEDDRNWYSVKYSFRKICEELKNKWKIDKDDFSALIEVYTDFRNPIQHWIYQRLTRKYYWEGSDWVVMISTDWVDNLQEMTKILEAAFSWEPNYELSKSWGFNRSLKLPTIMLEESRKMLWLIYTMILKFADDFWWI